MKVKQIHTLVNSVTKEILGETALIKEDLSNVVDVGKQIFDTENVDNYVKKLVNHIGKVIFVNRVYQGGVPSVLMDSWEFGSVLQKVTAELPEAEENESWALTDGKSYDPNKFHEPKVSAKFFNSKVTFEITLSFTEMQVKESFSNAEQLNGFLSMLSASVENSMTVKLDALIMRTINSFIAETARAELLDDTTQAIDPTLSGIRAVNLLKLYNDSVEAGEQLDKAGALLNRDFIRFATYQIGLYSDRMAKISKLFNIGAKDRFTPKDVQHVVLLSDFSKASETFLLSNTYNENMVTLPPHESVPYWQGSGLGYGFDDVSSIDVTSSTGEAQLSGILGVIFDRDALGVSNLDKRVTTNYNPKAEFYNNFYKFDAGFFNDHNENFVLFFVG